MPIDNAGAVFDWWTHALISDETYQGIISNCNFSNIGPLTYFEEDEIQVFSARKERKLDPATCNDFLDTANTEMGDIDIYDMYVDVCNSAGSLKIVEQLARTGSKFHQVMLKSHTKGKSRINPPYQPCADEFTQSYLNIQKVQQAIHANIPYNWTDCSGLVNYNFSDVEASVIPLYKSFLKSNALRILVYSGDVDAIVPVTGTRQWLSSLKLPINTPWASWEVNGQVGGYVTQYQGLTFTTVRNAGHMVPQTQPGRALAMFKKFLYNQPW